MTRQESQPWRVSEEGLEGSTALTRGQYSPDERGNEHRCVRVSVCSDGRLLEPMYALDTLLGGAGAY